MKDSFFDLAPLLQSIAETIPEKILALLIVGGTAALLIISCGGITF